MWTLIQSNTINIVMDSNNFIASNCQPRHENSLQHNTAKLQRKYSDDQGNQRSKSRSRSRQKNHTKKQPKIQAKREEQQNVEENDSDIDMFADDMQIKAKQQKQEAANKKQMPTTDETGYYIPIVGTIIGQKYKIIQKLGKGVFGIVIKVEDVNDSSKIYAVKILRKNQMTKASGLREYKILSQINQKRKLKRIMKVYDIFQVSGHLAIVCELLGTDLRSFSHKKQPTLADIRIYAIGMILIWHQLRLCRVVHADIKPDNFLFKQTKDLSTKTQGLNERAIIDNLKLADFGTSFWVEQYNSSVQYQVARYYRAPQIILGTKVKSSQVFAIDVWAIGCSLFELYTNQFLFNGNSNNDMLKLMMETKGKFSIKMLSKSQFRQKHFDDDFNFLHHTIDKITKQPKIQKTQINITAQRDLMNMLKKYGKNQNPKQLQNFRDFLQKCLTLNPKDRITSQEAIEHPFLHFQTKLEQ